MICKKLCTVSANDHVFQSFEKFYLWQNKFLPSYLPVVTRSQTGENDVFFRNLGPQNSTLFSQEKCLFVAGIWLIWKLMEYTNDHGPDASIIPTFYNKFL